MTRNVPVLTIPVPIPDEGKKLTKIFIFTRLCGTSKGFMKAFLKPFEAPQKSVKKKFKLIFILIKLSEMHGAGRVKCNYYLQ